MERLKPFVIAIIAPFMIVGFLATVFSDQPGISLFAQGTLAALAVAVVTTFMMVRRLGVKETIAWALLTTVFVALAAYMQWQNLIVTGVVSVITLAGVVFMLVKGGAAIHQTQVTQQSKGKQKQSPRESQDGANSSDDVEGPIRDAISKIFVKTGAMSATEQLDRASRTGLEEATAKRLREENEAKRIELEREKLEHEKAIERLEHAIRNNRPADVIARLEVAAYGTEAPKSEETLVAPRAVGAFGFPGIGSTRSRKPANGRK